MIQKEDYFLSMLSIVLGRYSTSTFRVVLISLTLLTRGLGSPSRAQHLSSLGFSCRRPFLVRKKVQPNHPFLIVEGFP